MLFIKSMLSVLMIVLACIAVFSMFEIMGRGEKRFDIGKLRKIHKANGIIYFLIFAYISYYCLNFIISSKAELSPRGTFHSIFALTILVLFAVKVSVIRVYRQFYNQARVFGLLIALITFGVVGTSGGYYLLATKFGTDLTFDKIMQYKKKGIIEKTAETIKVEIETDPESVGRGKNLFDAKCGFCHNAYSTETIVGPGLKGVLRNSRLPVSGRPATADNIRKQLTEPFNRMPSFTYLSEEEIKDIIAFLNTI